jgi:hypothetical protein
MQALGSTRSRLIVAAVLTVVSVLLLGVSFRVRSDESRAATGPTATRAATAVAGQGNASPTTRATPGATTAAGATAAVTGTARRATPTPPRGASPTAGPPTATVFGLNFTTEQLAADYGLVRQAIQQREPNAGLYAVQVVFARGQSSVETSFQLLSADGKRIFTYDVRGSGNRAATQRQGSPEAVTSEARFVTYQTPPWQLDPNWPTYFEEAAAQLAEGSWAAPENLGKAVIVARTEIPNDWELYYEALPRRFHFNVIQGKLIFTKVFDPSQPADLPPADAQAWSRYAGKETFARNFRLAPYGLSSNQPGAGFTPNGYRLTCAGASCSPFAATTLPSGSFGDVVAEAQFAKLAGPDDAQYGILLHAGAPDALTFTVNGNGRYTVAQAQASGQSNLLGQGDAANFQRGDFPNTLVAVLAGGTAHFFINGAEVWQGQVNARSTGDCAVITTSANLQVAVQYARVFEARGQ